ncbi:MAG: branched-chain amino acid ABC transporter permease, partial [Desulfobacterales bacterium]|nr:branched-chain amino acid ABC transporter permease [Desulfobacterales bacterium]
VPRPPIDLLWLSIDIGTPLHLYLFTTIFFVISLIICKWIVDSPFGAILCAIRDNTERTYFIGIHVRTYQLIIFIIAGTFAGLSGSLMALFISGAYPDFVYWTKSAEPIFMVLIGGMKNFLGPAVGAVIFFFLEDRIKLFTDLWGLVLGIILIIFTMVTRAGIIDFLAETRIAVYFRNTLDLPSRMLRLRRTFRETKKGGQ